MPEDLKRLFKKVFTLKYNEEPPYEALRSQLQHEFDREVRELKKHNASYQH